MQKWIKSSQSAILSCVVCF